MLCPSKFFYTSLNYVIMKSLFSLCTKLNLSLYDNFFFKYLSFFSPKIYKSYLLLLSKQRRVTLLVDPSNIESFEFGF